MSGSSSIPIAPDLGKLPKSRLHRAIPAPRTAALGAILWATVVTGSALWGIGYWATASHITTVLLLYGAGAALAFPLALFLAEAIAGDKMPTQRFAAAFLLIALVTVGMTALLFAVIYRAYYAHWHEEAFSRDWTLQFIGTFLSAFYQFAVIGLRLYVPFGLIGLFAASLWFAMRVR